MRFVGFKFYKYLCGEYKLIYTAGNLIEKTINENIVACKSRQT